MHRLALVSSFDGEFAIVFAIGLCVERCVIMNRWMGEAIFLANHHVYVRGWYIIFDDVVCLVIEKLVFIVNGNAVD